MLFMISRITRLVWPSQTMDLQSAASSSSRRLSRVSLLSLDRASGTTVEPGSKSGAVATVAPSEKGALLMFTLTALFTLLGGAWFLA